MKIEKENFLPNLFLGESIGQPFWEWENLKFDDREGRQVYVGELSSKSADFISYHSGENLQTKKYGIINSNYDIVLPFEYTAIKPKNPYFNQSYIKKDTYYFYIWDKKNTGLVKVENNTLTELLPPIYSKIEQTEHINFYECKIRNTSNLYHLLEEKFLFENGKYSKIDDTPFSSSMFNLYSESKCIIYDYNKNEIVIDQWQDIYFVNSLGSSLERKLYGLNGEKLTQYNLETFQPEELEIENGIGKSFRISCINQCLIARKYKNIIIQNYFK